MEEFKLTIKTENEAFGEGNCDAEIARILRVAADRIESDGYERCSEVRLMDINGNKVGKFTCT